MPRILYGISPIGLGHASRSLALGRRLMASGADVSFFSGGNVVDFLLAEGIEAHDIVSDLAPEVRDGEMKRTTLWYLKTWKALRATTQRTRRLFEGYHPDLVVCDEEFSGITVAREARLPNVFIADELELGFARSGPARIVERRVDAWYRRFQDSVEVILVPEYGADSKNLVYVGPMVREVTKGRGEVLAEILPPGGRMLLLSMSGSGIGDFLLRGVLDAFGRIAAPDTYLVISGNRGTRVVQRGVYDLGVVKENQNLVAAADLVISTAGKSTIDEAARSGTPIIAIPIRNHAEQERNAATIGFSAGDRDRLEELIRSKIGRREAPKIFRGVENASGIIMSMFGPPWQMAERPAKI
ncbi:MAG: hypothetical protein HY297_02470 [Thaumarchaeota archaeon]|nr:hypothetical protein [Nitrososphaerota archaeon]